MNTIIFFGSTTDSVVVLDKLYPQKNIAISAVVTQPPKPVGRDRAITPTPVETWAKIHDVAVLTFPSDPGKPWLYANESQVIDTLQPIGADLIVSASYGIKIPAATIGAAKYGGINIHPSILPRWRGADPVPWAILSGDHQSGVTIVSLSETFDDGKILAQEKIPITPTDTSDPLRTRLFSIGADLLTHMLPEYFRGNIKGESPKIPADKPPYARKFTRDDGFEPWDVVMAAISLGSEADRIERKFRALDPWPGLWTTLPSPSNKRLKIISLHVDNGKISIGDVQLEGKNPVRWAQFRSAYLPAES